MLDIARRKRDAVGLRERDLSLVQADLLDQKFDLRRRFDWVCVFFNTFLAFTTLAQQDRVLQNARKHLKSRGRLWLDLFHPDLTRLARDREEGLEPVAFHVPRYDRTVLKTTDVRRDPARQLMTVTFNYTWFDPEGRERRERRTFDMTWLFPRELQLLLERNGFELEHLWGNYDGSELNADSPRMIARCALA
jgi:SAM-dependent methyltransferase